jgi:hypothetical protein
MMRANFEQHREAMIAEPGSPRSTSACRSLANHVQEILRSSERLLAGTARHHSLRRTVAGCTREARHAVFFLYQVGSACILDSDLEPSPISK